MKYPCLIPVKMCRTDIHMELEQEGLQENGEPLPAIVYDGKCNYQDRAGTVFTAEKKLVEITGTALIPGDICPDMAAVSGGTAVVFGGKRRIQQGIKARNPDGTVNYTEVLLI